MTDRLIVAIPTRRASRGSIPRFSAAFAPAFTLVELLVVIGIIALLISILLPVVSKVRIASQVAATRNFVNQLGSAIERYQQDFRAYPGPMSNNEILDPNAFPPNPGSPFTAASVAVPAGVPAGQFDTTTQTFAQMYSTSTMSENLVLGLLGGLRVSASPATLIYDPSAVGNGPSSLGTVGIPKRYPAYIDAQQLSWRTGPNGKTGQYQDDAAAANDSIIPEFQDSFSDPMPILYLRAKAGANPSSSVTPFTGSYNPIITNDFTEKSVPDPNNPTNYLIRAGQYDLSQIIGYTAENTTSKMSIGVGKRISKSDYSNFTPAPGPDFPHGLQTATYNATPSLTSQYPYDAYPYLISSSGGVRQKDGYILISAGADRVYGTKDDICNFGDVGQ